MAALGLTVFKKWCQGTEASLTRHFHYLSLNLSHFVILFVGRFVLIM